MLRKSYAISKVDSTFLKVIFIEKAWVPFQMPKTCQTIQDKFGEAIKIAIHQVDYITSHVPVHFRCKTSVVQK